MCQAEGRAYGIHGEGTHLRLWPKSGAQRRSSKINSFRLTSRVSYFLQLPDLASYFLIQILVLFHLALGILFLGSQYLFLASLFSSTLATHIVCVYLFLLHCLFQTSNSHLSLSTSKTTTTTLFSVK